MKRREFIKLATAPVALAAIPPAIAFAIQKPSEIEWTVLQDPSYAFAYRVMGTVEINGVPFISSYILEPGEGKEQEMIDKTKSMIMADMERQYASR